MKTLKIDINLAKATFGYSKTTGKLKWLIGKFAGEEAGTINGCGYRIVEWLGKKWYAHRLAVALVTGQDPEGLVVDHTDYDRKNNKWKNLRLCTQRENLLRKRSSGRQTLRYRGIEKRLYSFGWRYRAVLVVTGKKLYGKPVKTQKAAYKKHLQLFAKHNGVKNMCPKMLTDYTTR
jgi:hypothetical protein